MESSFKSIDEVVKANFCIGCGACASIKGTSTTMRPDSNGLYQPILLPSRSDQLKKTELAVCPFGSPVNESMLSAQLFPDTQKHQYIGKYLEAFAGYVKNFDERSNSSSGGVGSWILEELLEQGMVDGVAHVGSATGEAVFKYKMSRSANEIKAGKKSKYYSTEFSDVVSEIRTTPGKYAITGVPCYIKAIQLLRNSDPILKERIVFTVGLVCGHMKTHAYTQWLAWEAGVAPGEEYTIDYRHKNPDEPANNYSTLVTTGGRQSIIKNRDLPLNKWGYGLFKPNACEYCDDIFAETADICIGDAWLPKYVDDPMGTNIVIVRNAQIMAIFDAQKSKKSEIHIEKLTPKQIVESQLGGIRHRTEGLAHRLASSEPRVKPTKRTAAKKSSNVWVGRMYDSRYKLSMESHKLFRKAKAERSLDTFTTPIRQLTGEYETIYHEARKSAKERLSELIEKRAPHLFRALKFTLQKVRSLQKQQ